MLTADFAQKWLPQQSGEPSNDYYGKAGLSLHVTHALCRNQSGGLIIHTIAHNIGYVEQVNFKLLFLVSKRNLEY